MNFRRRWRWWLLIVPALALLIWLVGRSPGGEGAVTVRFVGTTNVGNRTLVLFAITNRYATNIRGSAFQLIKATNGWVEASAPLRYPTGVGRRDLWLSAAGTADDGTIIGVVPPSEGAWVTVFDPLFYGPRKSSWRNRATIFLYEHRLFTLAGWVRPRNGMDWAKDPRVVIGPEMRGQQPD